MNYAVYDNQSDTWRFTDYDWNDQMNALFKPNHIFSDDAGYITTVTGNQYNYIHSFSEGSNPIFVVAENETSGILSFSPVLECGHVNSVKNFNLANSIGTGIDGYTVYLLRMFVDNYRNNCDIDDFYYLKHRKFILKFKAYNTTNNVLETVLSYEIDPTDQNGVVSFVDITIEEPNTISTGHAMKLSLSQYANDFGPNGIPSWYSVWITDITGLERFCISVGGEDTTVTEN